MPLGTPVVQCLKLGPLEGATQLSLLRCVSSHAGIPCLDASICCNRRFMSSTSLAASVLFKHLFLFGKLKHIAAMLSQSEHSWSAGQIKASISGMVLLISGAPRAAHLLHGPATDSFVRFALPHAFQKQIAWSTTVESRNLCCYAIAIPSIYIYQFNTLYPLCNTMQHVHLWMQSFFLIAVTIPFHYRNPSSSDSEVSCKINDNPPCGSQH